MKFCNKHKLCKQHSCHADDTQTGCACIHRQFALIETVNTSFHSNRVLQREFGCDINNEIYSPFYFAISSNYIKI